MNLLWPSITANLCNTGAVIPEIKKEYDLLCELPKSWFKDPVEPEGKP
jgi:hypothetical protein